MLTLPYRHIYVNACRRVIAGRILPAGNSQSGAANSDITCMQAVTCEREPFIKTWRPGVYIVARESGELSMTRAGSSAMRFDANYREDVTLDHGLRVRLRTVTPADREMLVEGFARLSAESRQRRFMGTKAALSEAELRFLTSPDSIDHVAIGAVDIGADGEERDGAGIGHLLRSTEHPEVAELALTMQDARQGKGIGHMLLVRLIAAAAEREVRRIRCHLLADNTRMRGLIEPVLGDAVFTREGDTMTCEFPVPANAQPEHLARDQAAAPLFGLLRLVVAGAVLPLDFTIAGLRYSIGSMALHSPSSTRTPPPEPDAKDETGNNS